jgi:hypothetical protein
MANALIETFDYKQFLEHEYDYEEVFFVYLRIFQLLNISILEGNIKYPIEDVFKNLEPFFGYTVIERALKILIYSGVIVETDTSTHTTPELKFHRFFNHQI